MLRQGASAGLFASVSRRAFWAGTGLITLVLVGVTAWMGGYVVKVPEENLDARVTTNDPMTEILYSPVGNAVVMLVLQFLGANVLFWVGVWVWGKFEDKFRGRGEPKVGDESA
ncbi:MAG: hypothetical protein AAFX76_04760 [Planctomycetota bacterium]